MNAKITVDTTAALTVWNNGMDPALSALEVSRRPATVTGPGALTSALAGASDRLADGYVNGGEYLARLSLGFLRAMENLETVEQHNAALPKGKGSR